MQILRRPEVERRTGFGRSAIYAGIAAGTFPAPIKLSVRSVGWLEADILGWITSRVAASTSHA